MNTRINQILQKHDKTTDQSTLLGPWLGEFGPELVYWQGFVRRYCENHPEEYVIAAGHPGNRALYESVDEYWEIFLDRKIEPNFYLAGKSLPRRLVYTLIRQMSDEGILPDKIGLPDRLHESGQIEFGNPNLNQSFRVLSPSSEMRDRVDSVLDSDSLVMVFPREREVDPSKNWSSTNWCEFCNVMHDQGHQIIVGGGRQRPDVSKQAIDPWTWGVKSSEWMDLQLAIAERSWILVSGESGPGFLPGLCGRPGVVFGSPRESQRYRVTDNIFSSTILYISCRDPSVVEVAEAVERINNERI